MAVCTQSKKYIMSATPNIKLILAIAGGIQGGRDASDIVHIIDTCTGGVVTIAARIIEACLENLCELGDDFQKAVFIELVIRKSWGPMEITKRYVEWRQTNHCSKCGHTGHDKNHCTIPKKWARS